MASGTVEIIAVNGGDYEGKKFRVAECILRGEKTEVGKLTVWDAETPLSIGLFVVEWAAGVDFKGKVVARIAKLLPAK